MKLDDIGLMWPIRLKDGCFGVTIKVFPEEDMVGCQVPGEEDMRWVHAATVGDLGNGALLETEIRLPDMDIVAIFAGSLETVKFLDRRTGQAVPDARIILDMLAAGVVKLTREEEYAEAETMFPAWQARILREVVYRLVERRPGMA